MSRLYIYRVTDMNIGDYACLHNFIIINLISYFQYHFSISNVTIRLIEKVDWESWPRKLDKSGNRW